MKDAQVNDMQEELTAVIFPFYHPAVDALWDVACYIHRLSPMLLRKGKECPVSNSFITVQNL